MALVKAKIKKYIKEAVLFGVALFVISGAVSLYRTSSMEISDDVCKKGADVVYFWATWCPVCKMTSPNVDRVAKSFDVQSIAVSSGDEAEVRSYMSERELHFRLLNDKDGKIAAQNGVHIFPTIVFCKDGEVRLAEAGYISTLGLWLRAWIFS